MLFNSWQFLVFFPLVTGLYFALPHRFRWALLLMASCLFYMAFIPAYILILAFTIMVDYAAGRLIAKAEGPRRFRLLWVSIAANLGILAFFKYFNFFNDNLRGLAELLHWNYPVEALAIILPIGLSFHIFQSLSYTIEVYRGNQAPERHFGIYALYVMFYPQLVAGPIERPQNLLPQFHAEKRFNEADVSEGLQRMLRGLFKKVVIADRLALLVNPVFANPTEHTGLTLIAATVCFAVQIYCDFSGYSDIAIGAARVMGFRLMENFNRPYLATSIRDFWGRWHISLSTWFKDYLYIPLGGNRVVRWRWCLNLLIVFLVSGLWHGANWTFIVWGALHGAYQVAEILTGAWRRAIARATAFDRAPGWLQTGLRTAVTFSLVAFAWIFFRAASLGDAWYIASHLFAGLGAQLAGPEAVGAALGALGGSHADRVLAFALIAGLLAVQVVQHHPGLRARFASPPRPLRWAVYQAAVLGLVLFGVYDSQAFIYFQF
jgi:D-alanyl-lipoteichoic acid acyltransferase DltB (MBOAT superfamily)